MSQWLKSVNNLLEKLDDRVETVVVEQDDAYDDDSYDDGEEDEYYEDGEEEEEDCDSDDVEYDNDNVDEDEDKDVTEDEDGNIDCGKENTCEVEDEEVDFDVEENDTATSTSGISAAGGAFASAANSNANTVATKTSTADLFARDPGSLLEGAFFTGAAATELRAQVRNQHELPAANTINVQVEATEPALPTPTAQQKQNQHQKQNIAGDQMRSRTEIATTSVKQKESSGQPLPPATTNNESQKQALAVLPREQQQNEPNKSQQQLQSQSERILSPSPLLAPSNDDSPKENDKEKEEEINKNKKEKGKEKEKEKEKEKDGQEDQRHRSTKLKDGAPHSATNDAARATVASFENESDLAEDIKSLATTPAINFINKAHGIIKATGASSGIVSAAPANAGQQQQQQQQMQTNSTNSERKLRKQVQNLKSQLSAAQAEIIAQQEELQRVAERMDREYQRANEERDDLLDDHEEEIENLKEHYEQALIDQKNLHEQHIDELRKKLRQEEDKRLQEGGDWTKELQDALDRERNAIKRFDQVVSEKSALQSKLTAIEKQYDVMKGKLESTSETAKLSSEREREAEAKLDAALSLHSRQLNQRRAREVELERTVTELGAALTAAKATAATATAASALGVAQTSQKHKQSSVAVGESTDVLEGEEVESFQHKYEIASEELDNVKSQLYLEKKRCEALRQELSQISKERTEEASAAQSKQRQFDMKEAEFVSKITQLEANLRGFENMVNNSTENKRDRTHKDTYSYENSKKATHNVGPSEEGTNNSSSDKIVIELRQQAAEAKKHIAHLSEQLLRQQGIVEMSKSELLTLKGRLKAATARAEDAEKAMLSMPSSSPPSSANSGRLTSRMYEMEGGGIGVASGTAVRRRVKGVGRYYGGGRSTRGGSFAFKRIEPGSMGEGGTIRSIRSALNLNPGLQSNSTFMEQVLVTIDAIDSFLLETGIFMIYEPIARFAFFLYFTIMHFWCFGLVVFHATEADHHGDFGSLKLHK